MSINGQRPPLIPKSWEIRGTLTCTLKALWENWGRHVERRNEVTNTKEKELLYVYVTILNLDIQVQS